MAHVPGPAYAGLIDQSTPGPPGSGSVIVAAFATPVPPFVRSIVKPINCVVETDGASAIFPMINPGARTVVVSVADADGPFVDFAVAVFA